jgi:CRP/FNR family cyclic AMP-dependent transcriptional regulator
MEWPLLADVPPDDVRQLLSIARRRTFSRNEVVVHRGDPADSMHLIASGRFAVRITMSRGDTALIAVRGPGDSFGELALVSENAKRVATVSALEPGETWSVYRDDFVRIRRQHPGVDAVLVHLLAEEVRRLSERLTEAYYEDADTRIRRRLVELAGRAEGAAATIPLTQEALAEMAGTSRATVNRVLREEAKRGSIELGRGKTVVRQLDELARRARI